MLTAISPRRSTALLPPREEIIKALAEVEEEAAVLRGLLRLAHRRETPPKGRARPRGERTEGAQHGSR